MTCRAAEWPLYFLPVNLSGQQFADEPAEAIIGIFFRYAELRAPAGAGLEIGPALHFPKEAAVANIPQGAVQVRVAYAVVPDEKIVVNIVQSF